MEKAFLVRNDFISPQKVRRILSPKNMTTKIKKIRYKTNLSKKKCKLNVLNLKLGHYKTSKNTTPNFKTTILRGNQVKKLKPINLVSKFTQAKPINRFRNKDSIFSPIGNPFLHFVLNLSFFEQIMQLGTS